MGKVRGVRFSDVEDKLIDQFLAANPLLDFTTLAKIAILGFLKKPKIEFQAVKPPTKGERIGT